MIDKVYELVCEELIPYATYFRDKNPPAHVVVDNRIKGFSTETTIVLLAGVAIGSFFKGLFGAWGKMAAEKSAERIARKFKTGSNPDVTALRNITNELESLRSEIGQLSKDEITRAKRAAELEVEKELENAGLPSKKARMVSARITVLNVELLLEGHPFTKRTKGSRLHS